MRTLNPNHKLCQMHPLTACTTTHPAPSSAPLCMLNSQVLSGLRSLKLCHLQPVTIASVIQAVGGMSRLTSLEVEGLSAGYRTSKVCVSGGFGGLYLAGGQGAYLPCRTSLELDGLSAGYRTSKVCVQRATTWQ